MLFYVYSFTCAVLMFANMFTCDFSNTVLLANFYVYVMFGTSIIPVSQNK